jgi:hypothetical protein
VPLFLHIYAADNRGWGGALNGRIFPNVWWLDWAKIAAQISRLTRGRTDIGLEAFTRRQAAFS